MKRDMIDTSYSDFINDCPECRRACTVFVWVEDESLGEYQHGECLKCGHEWNECARDKR